MSIVQKILTPALSRFAGEGASRSRMLRLLWVFALSAFEFFPTRLFAADLHSLIVLSYPDRPAKLPLWLAQDAGLFEKYGLKVDIKTPKSGEDIVAGIGRDEAQIYAATANWIVSGDRRRQGFGFFRQHRL